MPICRKNLVDRCYFFSAAAYPFASDVFTWTTPLLMVFRG
ncbi:MAG: hypothetical protein A4E67_01412 [Syntrophaceae bacterium PtaB.Bin038]|nr:MAG: hypothetical protein A4E67_01412 [Syntrophaceae bacterium PtaB.Bin038]